MVNTKTVRVGRRTLGLSYKHIFTRTATAKKKPLGRAANFNSVNVIGVTK